VKVVRVVSRLALLTLAAAAFAGLTGIYGSSVQVAAPSPRYREAHQHLPPAPQGSQFLEFLRAGLELAVFAVGGRLGLRLRLSSAPPGNGQPVVLGLSEGAGAANLKLAQAGELKR
jgi:hypothetical protein